MTNSDLKQRALRLIDLETAAKEAKADVDAACAAAASAGYTKAALKKAIKIHTLEPEKRARHDAAQMDLELYLAEIEGSQLREAAE